MILRYVVVRWAIESTQRLRVAAPRAGSEFQAECMRCMGDLHKRLAYRVCDWRWMLRQNDSLRLMRAFRKTREPPRQSFLLVCELPLEASKVVKVPRIGVLLKLHPLPCSCHSASCLACLSTPLLVSSPTLPISPLPADAPLGAHSNSNYCNSNRTPCLCPALPVNRHFC